MTRTVPMKSLEIRVIVRQHGTLVGTCVREYRGIGNALATAPCIVNREHIVAEALQLLHHRQREVFVGI